MMNIERNGGSMPRLDNSIDIKAPVDKVFGYISDATAHPEWLTLHAYGSLTLNSGARIDGYVVDPVGQVTINGNSVIAGGLASDRLTLNSKALLDLVAP